MGDEARQDSGSPNRRRAEGLGLRLVRLCAYGFPLLSYTYNY